MNKTLTYSGFAISSIFIILAFVTAKTYTQLAIAVLLYPLLAYFALKLLPHGNRKGTAITIQIPKKSVRRSEESGRQKVDVADIDKRTFLKLVGTAGISFFIFSILGRRVESLLFGNALQSGVSSLNGTPANQAGSTEVSPTEGYKISEIEEGTISFYGFINKDGAWLIMREDVNNSSFRYAKGNFGFSQNWANRENLKYDYFHNLF